MICPEPTMSRRRPHTGEKGRFYFPRSATAVTGLNVRDIQDAFVRALCLCSQDKDLIENAKQGENATLHANHLFMIDMDKLNLLDVQQALGEELEKIMGIYPNVHGAAEMPVPQRRATDGDHMRMRSHNRITGSVHDDDMIGVSFPQMLDEPFPPQYEHLKPKEECGETVRAVYNGWREREKIQERCRQLGIAEPKESWMKRLCTWWKND